SRPSFLEWLGYMLLIKLFSPPKSLSRLISSEILSINFFNGNKPNTFSFLVGKDYFKQDISLNNQNDDQDIHLIHPEPVHLKDSSQYCSLDLSSHYLNLSTSSDLLIVGDDEGRIDVVNDEPTKRRSGELAKIFRSDIDLPQETELLLKWL
ncbi:5307_t:CDS:2, partial [Racocetra fulgida]